jgi:hypothetical protein
MTALPTPFWRVFDFWVGMTLTERVSGLSHVLKILLMTYFVSVSEPCGSLLLAAHESNPLVTAPAQTFPHIGIAIHASSFLRLLKWAASCSTDTMGETFIVPESAVLQYKPPPRLANPTPPFALITVTPDPTRRVEVTVKAKFLLVWYQIRIARVHVFRGRRHLLLVEGCIEIGRITQISVM